jgi:hypothetical protein
MKQGPVLTLLVGMFVVILASAGVIMYIAQIGPFAPGGPIGHTTTAVQTSTVIGAACQPNIPQPVKYLMAHYSGDSAITHPNVNVFSSNAQGQLVQISDNPGQLTDGTVSAASTNLYPIGPPYYVQMNQAGETGAYPAWYQLNSGMLTNPVDQFGNHVFQVACQPSASNPSAYIWTVTGVLFQAPTTANSTASTSYAIASIQYPAGTATAVPTTATTWNVNLLIGQPYRTAMQPYAECGTQASPVYNYATGTEYFGCPAGPGQGGLPTVSGYLIVLANQTSISISAPGAQVLKSPAMATGVLAWSIPVTGAGVAPSSATAANPFVAVSVPVQIQTSLTYAGGRHVAIVFWFVDMQQISYVQNYLSTAAAASWTTVAGTEAGTSGYTSATGSAPTTWFGGLTPTAGQNAGNPVPLLNQYIGVNLPY